MAEKVEWSVELNQNTLCVYGLSKGRNAGMTEYINLELSVNDKGNDQLTKKVISVCCYCNYNYRHNYYFQCCSYYHITTFTIQKGNLNEIERHYVHAHCHKSVFQEEA